VKQSCAVTERKKGKAKKATQTTRTQQPENKPTTGWSRGAGKYNKGKRSEIPFALSGALSKSICERASSRKRKKSRRLTYQKTLQGRCAPRTPSFNFGWSPLAAGGVSVQESAHDLRHAAKKKESKESENPPEISPGSFGQSPKQKPPPSRRNGSLQRGVKRTGCFTEQARLVSGRKSEGKQLGPRLRSRTPGFKRRGRLGSGSSPQDDFCARKTKRRSDIWYFF